MADLQLVIRYRTGLAKAGFKAIVALVPVWSLIAPALLGYLIRYVFENPSCAPTGVIVALVLTLVGITLGGISCCALFEDDRIIVCKDGIFIPLVLMGRRWRRNLFWSDMTAATITDERLVLSFKNTLPLVLGIRAIKPEEFEQLLMFIELWAANCQRSPELIAYAAKSRSDDKKLSYTAMWQDELSRRFANTSFVPLEPDNALLNGKLKIIRQLAFGGFSAIYLAQMNKVDLVVVKEAVVPGSVAAGARNIAEQHLAREARLLSALDHPQIARVLDYFVEDDRHYMVLEHVAGQDLYQYIRQNGPQSEPVVLNWAKQMADIVSYLHNQDPPVVHRDLSPDNIVLKNDGTLVLIDFGASNEFVGTATGTMIGKQAYIAPEQLRGKAVPKSDLYALGCTLYFVLTGQEPVPLMVSHPKNIVAVSDQFDALIAACTALDTSGRVTNAAEFSTRLETISGETIPLLQTANVGE